MTTNPAGLNVVVTYTDLEGTVVASPTEVGEYAVVATVDDGNYKGIGQRERCQLRRQLVGMIRLVNRCSTQT